jgi:hypothetical protein
MRGEASGYYSEQAEMASLLYRWWRLPRAPLVRLAADPESPLMTRRLALRALRDLGVDGDGVAAALSALCAVVDRAQNLRPGHGHQNQSGDVSLTDDEFRLLSEAPITADDARGRIAFRLREIVPADNPLIPILRDLSSWW